MKKILLLVLGILFLTQISLEEEHKVCPLGDDFHRSYIGIHLLLVRECKNSREIRISWGNERFKVGDTILLLSHDTVKGFKKIYDLKPTKGSGIKDTGLYIDSSELFVDSPEQNFTSKCIKYYVAWIRQGFIRDINCLGIQPTWMADERHLIGNKTLRDLFIPGTHDSGSYDLQGYNGLGNFLKRYTKTQDLNVLDQLLFGVRYLDIRVGYYPDHKDSIWWVNHDMIPMVPLDTVIDQVITFLSKTNEIVIFNVREFPVGFNDHPLKHGKLLRHLLTKFEKYAVLPAYDWDVSLSTVWSTSSKRLYLTFDLTGKSFLYHQGRKPIAQYWGDADDAQVFYENLNAAERVPMKKDDSTPKVSIAELTLKSYKIPQEPLVNLRERANSINPNITLWYHKYWFDMANIVAVDFLPSSGIVDVAIRANKFRFTKREEIEANPTCVQPYRRTISNVQSVMNQPNVTNLLYPRIVDDASEKIYDLIALS